MDKLEIGAALDVIFDLLRRSNKYIDETTPWILAKDENEQEKLQTVLYNLLEAIRVSAIYLKSFLPDTADNIMNQINTTDETPTFNSTNTYKVNTPTPLFKRIEKEKYQQ